MITGNPSGWFCRLVNRWYTAVGTGSGTSKTVLTRYATVLNRVCQCRRKLPVGNVSWWSCLPLSAEENHGGKEFDGSKTRRTNGRYRVTFANGNHIMFVSHVRRPY